MRRNFWSLVDPGSRGLYCRFACLALAAAALALVLPDVSALAQPIERSEHEVKAAFLFNFGKYVKWPAGPAEPNAEFVVCVLGADPFGASLEDMAHGNPIQNRPVQIRHLAGPRELAGCQVAFISASEQDNLDKILQQVRNLPVLTVGDMPQFAERGGMISLRVIEGRVRFDVNVEATEHAGLTPSSQLLRLAKVVQTARPAR